MQQLGLNGGGYLGRRVRRHHLEIQVGRRAAQTESTIDHRDIAGRADVDVVLSW